MVMEWSAAHAGFVYVCYAIVACVLLAMVGHTLWRARSLKRQLAEANLPDVGVQDKP
jgi:heme exporter protein CcmD